MMPNSMFTIKNGVLQYSGRNISSGMKISKKAFKNLVKSPTVEEQISLLKKMDMVVDALPQNTEAIYSSSSILVGNYICELW